MKTVCVERVVVGQQPAWGKWPDGEDVDYAPIEARRAEARYARAGVELRVTTRFLPVYAAYARAGVRAIPRGPYWIDNTLAPDPGVVRELVAALERAARDGCRVCWWEHGHQCFPEVARRMRELFPLTVLQFADDCPGSSERKTFPVARWFDVVYHMMGVWDFATGVRTADKYRALGVAYTKLLPMDPTPPLLAALRADGFDAATKAAAIAAGALAPRLAFVGYATDPASARGRLLAALGAGRDALHARGVATSLHGVGMPDGVLEPRTGPGVGRALADLYARATLGLNAPVSSLYNRRLFDLWLAGVAQLVHDPHGELGDLGFRPGAHFLPYDGTPEGLADAAARAAADRAGTAALVRRAHAAATAFLATHNPTAAYADIFFDHVDRLG